MKFRQIADFHKKLAKKLGDDLIYSIALDNGEIKLVISTHKSTKQRYKDKEIKTMQSCLIKPEEFENTVNQIVDKIVKLYKPILEPKPNESKSNNGI